MSKAFPEDEWTDERGTSWTRDEFYQKMDSEGGLSGLVTYGGAGIFPPSLRPLMREVEKLQNLMDNEEVSNE